MENHCFSPETYDRPYASDANIKCYISCPGTVDGGVSEGSDSPNILRFTPSQRGGRSVGTVLSEMIFQVYGGELVRFCHFGTELCIIERLLERLQGMKVDLRPIMGGAPIYNTRKHLEKLGLHRELPGLCLVDADRPDNFMKFCVWKSGGGAVGSEGACVNMWALLAAASLVGCDHIHCKSSSRFAQSVLSLVLKSAPASATPGDLIPVRSFHEVSKEVEIVSVDSTNRPENFLRPIDDGNFAANGIFSYCPVVDGEMPEDYLGCGYVREMSKFLKCKYHEVPPRHVHGSYQLMPGRYHAVYGKERDVWGSMIINDGAVLLVLENSQAFSWEFHEWEDKLREEGLLVMPTIWRSGAAVRLDGGVVGCLVPDGTRDSMTEQGDMVGDEFYLSNYDHIQHAYWARCEQDKMLPLKVIDTMERLIAPGAFLWIKPGSAAWEKLAPRFPPSALPEADAVQRALRVRLNVPLAPNPEAGKVHVTVIRRKKTSRRNLDFNFDHITVDPWELTADPPGNSKLEIKELVG